MKVKEIGFLKVDRKIMSWRWYKNGNTFRLFMHLLLSANFEEAQFEEHTIKRGQVVTGRKKLSDDTGMTEREIRTALKHLKTTNDITIKTTSKYSIITIVNYEAFQGATNTLTSDRPASDQQTTSYRPQYKKNKKNKKYNKQRVYEVNEEHIKLFDSKSLFND